MSRIQEKTLRMVELALLAAIIIVLQMFINIPLPGGLTLSLVLVPIVIGAVLLGPSAGAVLGAIFGAVVTVLVITGRAGALSTAMWVTNPVMTVLVCMLKGTAAGWVPGLIARAFQQHRTVGIVLAAAAAPLLNTGIFLLGMFTCFYGVMSDSAASIGMGGVSMVYFAVVVLVGVNFLVEFAANVVLSPAIASIVRAVRKTNG